MKKKVLIYFHGYGANPNSDKVQKLRNMGYEVVSFSIDVDPRISIPKLTLDIDHWLIDNFARENIDLIFIGSSLGGWYAVVMGALYHTDTVTINPSIRPNITLKRYGISEDVLNSYNDLEFSPDRDPVIIAKDDEVLNFDNEPLLKTAKNVLYSPTGKHRFNGPEFEEYIKKVLESNP